MVSTMNSGNAGSFTSAYEFESGHKVKIDGRMQGTVLKKKITSTIGDMYQVIHDGTEFIITVPSERLTQIETQSET